MTSEYFMLSFRRMSCLAVMKAYSFNFGLNLFDHNRAELL